MEVIDGPINRLLQSTAAVDASAAAAVVTDDEGP